MLGRDTTVSLFMRDVMRDMKITPSDPLYIERFRLISDASKTIQNLFADVVAPQYMDESIIVSDTTGRYSTATGTWTASTSTLAITMNTNFASTDVGKLVTFRIGSATYVGYVATYVGIGSVTVGGDNLPGSNGTVDYAILVSTPLSNDTISLSSLRLLRLGSQLMLELSSTGTTAIDPVTLDALRRWDSTAYLNRNKIVWSLSGDRIYLKKGSNLSTYGTMTLRFPRLAEPVTANGDYVDVPEGAPMEVCKFVVKRTMADRMNMPLQQYLPNYEAQIRSFVESIYRSFQGDVKKTLVEEKIKALI